MKRVLIRPTFQDWCGNRLFTDGTSWQGLYRSAFSAWKEKAMALGIQIDTWDQAPLETCDLLWLVDLPTSKKELEQIRSRLRLGTPIVLQVFESPAVAPFGFVCANQKHVLAVVTYELPDGSPGNSNHFHYHLPVPVLWPVKVTPLFRTQGLVDVLFEPRQRFLGDSAAGTGGVAFFWENVGRLGMSALIGEGTLVWRSVW